MVLMDQVHGDVGDPGVLGDSLAAGVSLRQGYGATGSAALQRSLDRDGCWRQGLPPYKNAIYRDLRSKAE